MMSLGWYCRLKEYIKEQLIDDVVPSHQPVSAAVAAPSGLTGPAAALMGLF
jgi:hypothetical protein